jgi:hypothetical protein
MTAADREARLGDFHMITQSDSFKSLGHYEAPSAFKDDLEILDRYQMFSAEIVRISLLGLSGLGILIFNLFVKNASANQSFAASHELKWEIILTALLFGIASSASLLHRYFSSDGMACHLRVLRMEKAGRDVTKERKRRSFMLAMSKCAILVGPLSLAIAGLAFTAAIGAVLFN